MVVVRVAGHGEDGRHPVHRVHQVLGHSPPVLPLDPGVVDEGHAPGSSLPHRVLPSSQRPVGASLRPAIVRHEHDGRVVVLPGGLQGLRHVLDGLVQDGDHAEPLALLAEAAVRLVKSGVAVGDLDGFVDTLEGEIEEDRLLSSLLDHLHRLPAEEVGAVLALPLLGHRLVVPEVVAFEDLPTVGDNPLVIILAVSVEPEESIKPSPVNWS